MAPDPTAREALGGQAFMSGKVGMHISGHWAIPGFRAAEAEAQRPPRREVKREAFGLSDIGVVGLPRDKARANVVYESGWAVARDSEQPELAVELAKYLAGAEAQRRRAAIGLAISANRRWRGSSRRATRARRRFSPRCRTAARRGARASRSGAWWKA